MSSRSELGPVVGPVVSDRIVAVLADGSGLREADLDGWLTHEFFKRHVERTMGEPVVWHLKSNNGCIQVLVGAQRLDKHRLQLLEKELVTPRTDLLRRELLEADAHGDEASSALLRAELEDVEEFGAALELLRNGTNQPSGAVHPSSDPMGLQPTGSRSGPMMSDPTWLLCRGLVSFRFRFSPGAN